MAGGGGGKDAASSGGEVLFEFRRVGAQLRVAAIDSKTGVEVVIIAPLTATQPQIQALALAKLRRRLAAGQ
jgi:hypothetical protein